MSGYVSINDQTNPDRVAIVTSAGALKVDGSGAGGGAVTIASGGVASGAYAAGALAAGAGVDGWDLTQGAKADAAVINPASSGSVIALLKGWLTGLGAIADAAWTSGNGSMIALLKAIAGAAISTNPAQTYVSNTYSNITTTATTVVKSGAGTFSKIVINKAAATGVITVYDNTAASGTIIATLTEPAALLASQNSIAYDVAFATGLTIVTGTAAQDITVVYR